MNLLVWYWGRRGGPVRITHDLIRALATESRHRLSVSLSTGSELFDAIAGLGLPGCHVATYSGPFSAIVRSLAAPRVAARLAAFTSSAKHQVAICIMRHPWSPWAFRAMRRAGARILLMVHDASPHPGETYPLWQRHLALDLRWTDGIIVFSRHVAATMTRVFGYPPDRIWQLPLPAPLLEYRSAPRSLPLDRPVELLFFGRFLEYKGLDILAGAIGRLGASRPFRLRVIGSGSVPALETLASLPNVEVANAWIPESEIDAIIRASDVIVLPYREASQSGVVPMAYAAGVPVVATPVGGLSEQVVHEETGLIAGSVDADAFAGALRRLLGDAELYARCSCGAVARSTGGWRSDTVAQELTVVAERLAAMPPRRPV